MILRRIIKSYSPIGLLRLIRDLLYTKIFCRPARIVRLPVYIRSNIKFKYGVNFTSGVGLRIDIISDNAKLFFGNNVQINDYCHIGVFEKVVIGDRTIIGSKVLIMDHNHGIFSKPCPESSPFISPIERPIESSPVNIGKNVWIGENVMILPGTKIGDGCIISAGSVVSGHFPNNTVISGNPGRVKMEYNFKKQIWELV
jgi:lipopolysaccharide O-acetyltransferase